MHTVATTELSVFGQPVSPDAAIIPRSAGSNSTPKNGRVRQAELRSRLVQAGLAQVAVWVPQGTQPEVQRLAELLRLSTGKVLPHEMRPDAEPTAELQAAPASTACPGRRRGPGRAGREPSC